MEQDLLKCLHHFAAKYYSDKGQLIDASRIARQQKKAKKKANMSTDPGSRSNSWSTADPNSGEESDSSDIEIAPASSATPQTSKQKGRQGANLVKDMYKMLDGSALVALGKHTPMRHHVTATHCGIQEFLSTSISNDLFDGTGPWVLKIPKRNWTWSTTKRTGSICRRGVNMFTR